MARQLVTPLLLLLFLAARPALAADTVLGESCDLEVVGTGISDKQDFLEFDHELRTALSRQDPVALAVLVKFPLAVNYPDATSISLNNAATLQARFAEVFPPTLRAAVLRRQVEDLFCNWTGIMYGNGEVWIRVVGRAKGERFRIVAVNLPAAADKKASAKGPRVIFICDVEKHRVVIDSDRAGKVRYRVWNKPRFVTEKPNMEIGSGTTRYEGTGLCARSIWTFRTGNTEFIVSTAGCSDGSEPPGTIGNRWVSVAGDLRQNWWCY